MVYASDSNKWRAYQFSDPFAAGLFLVCNKVNKMFCRPDCDAHPTTELRSLIKFVDTTQEAISLGYVPCETCGPMSVPKIDVNLLLRTVKDCNNRIGFVPPLMDDDESKITETIKENIIGQGMQRRQLVPAISYDHNKYNTEKTASYSVSKNDSEHYRLIDLACRHLALAAANSIFSPQSPSGSLSPVSDGGSPDKKKSTKKRRGGVLGFKELAAKSKLSAWHFHRVFKSITGLTPKNYGDMCWEYLEKDKSDRGSNSVLSPPPSMRESPVISMDNGNSSLLRNSTVLQDQDHQLNSTVMFNTAPGGFSYVSPTHSDSSLQMLPINNKRPREEEFDDLEYSPKRFYMQAPSNGGNAGAGASNASMNNSTGYNSHYDSEFGPYVDFSNRATSVPDLMLYGSTMPNSLFDHSKPMEFSGMASEQPIDGLDVADFSPSSITITNAPPHLLHDPYLPTEDIINEAIFAESDMFCSDLFAEPRNDYFTGEVSNDPMMMGFIPEIVTGTD
ncbi:hypothetical protein PUMCH_001159 [Australozyma saopauloensis]|uniref:Ada DNA repair metal-binding domain-containing protein n=1 Tax=Australozyma saopauloensis TaxID=291208 RepID=A0AAX4H6C2_9ASCO|nr:hypothetical protein PUMCH_001159 [[Candida] saopauloensis]